MESQKSGGAQQDFYVLQDANFNVMALTDAGGVVEQYQWEPYGLLAAKDTDTGGTIPHSHIGHQGLFFYRFNPQTGDTATLSTTAVGLYFNRNRWYSASLGRFTSRDPNETGQLIVNVVIMNGEACPIVAGLFSAVNHYRDGLNLYNCQGSNPISGSDPLGLYGDYDVFDEIDDCITSMQAEKAAAAHHTLAITEALMKMAQRAALEALITAIVPGGGLVVAAWNIGEATGDIFENGLTWGNGIQLGFGAVSSGAEALRVLSRFRGHYASGLARSSGARLIRPGTWHRCSSQSAARQAALRKAGIGKHGQWQPDAISRGGPSIANEAGDYVVVDHTSGHYFPDNGTFEPGHYEVYKVDKASGRTAGPKEKFGWD